MKGLACGECFDIRTLDPNPETWVECRCGNVRGHWINPHLGIAQYDARNRTTAFGMGFHNTFLREALAGGTAMHHDARKLHDVATAAPGYVFDKSMAGCWAIIFKPGATRDTSWKED